MAYARDAGSVCRGVDAGKDPCVRTCIAVLCLLSMMARGIGVIVPVPRYGCECEREEATESRRELD